MCIRRLFVCSGIHIELKIQPTSAVSFGVSVASLDIEEMDLNETPKDWLNAALKSKQPGEKLEA